MNHVPFKCTLSPLSSSLGFFKLDGLITFLPTHSNFAFHLLYANI